MICGEGGASVAALVAETDAGEPELATTASMTAHANRADGSGQVKRFELIEEI